jgi:hypothetical protein
MMFLLSTGAVLSLIAKAVQLERRTFEDAGSYVALVAALTVLGIAVCWRNSAFARSPEGALQFEQAAEPAIFALNLHPDGVTPIPGSPGIPDPTSQPSSR